MLLFETSASDRLRPGAKIAAPVSKARPASARRGVADQQAGLASRGHSLAFSSKSGPCQPAVPEIVSQTVHWAALCDEKGTQLLIRSRRRSAVEQLECAPGLADQHCEAVDIPPAIGPTGLEEWRFRRRRDHVENRCAGCVTANGFKECGRHFGGTGHAER